MRSISHRRLAHIEDWDFTSKTGTIVQHVLDLRSAIADRRAPFDPRVERRRDFVLEQLAQDTPNL